MLRGFLFGSAALLAFAGGAAAADLPTAKPAPPPPAPVWNWSGIYAGVDGGFGWGDASWGFPISQFFANVAGQGFSSDPTGGLLGGHIGINQQFGSFVVGLEGAAEWADLTRNQVGVVSPAYPSDAYTTKFTDIESVTGRLGYAVTNWLFYGKAGVATSNLDFNALSGPPVAGVAAQRSFRLWGPTVGAGVEYMWTTNIVLGLEYDYSHFNRGAFATTGACTVAATCGTDAPLVTVSGSSVDLQSLLARISYKF